MRAVPAVPSVPGTDKFTCSPLNKGNREQGDGHQVVRSRSGNTSTTPTREWTLKAYHDGQSQEPDPDEVQRSIDVTRRLLSALISTLKNPTRKGVREELRVRLQRMHFMTAALRRDPYPPGARGSSRASQTAGLAERGISLGEPLEKSGQPGEIP